MSSRIEQLIDEIEEYICQYPIYQYTFAETEELEFSDKVRTICRKECSRYGHSWSCPPAVGSVKHWRFQRKNSGSRVGRQGWRGLLIIRCCCTGIRRGSAFIS